MLSGHYKVFYGFMTCVLNVLWGLFCLQSFEAEKTSFSSLFNNDVHIYSEKLIVIINH